MAIKKVRGFINYELSDDQIAAIREYLAGQLGSRQLGMRLGMSHQGAISVVSAVCRQWVQGGVLRFRKQSYGK